MEEKISNTRLNFACDQDWNTMKEDTEGRFCNTCQKKVYDMTDKNVAYFVQLMQENNNNVCGRFSRDQMAPASPVPQPYWKRWAIAAMMVMGLGGLTKETQAQNKLGKMLPPTPQPAASDGHSSIILGEVLVVPPAPEMISLSKYVAQHCHVPASTNGRLVASFTLSKDGSLKDIALTEQQPAEVRREVLRVLKNAPKWKTYKQENNQGYPLSLYITFIDGKIQTYN